MHREAIAAALIAGLAWALPSSAQDADGAPTIELSAGIHLIHAEVANDDRSRVRGLMFRESLPPNHGMLFVFPEDDTHCMWMKNTLVPLSVAFLSADGTVVNVENMKPQTEDKHCAGKPVHLALEMSFDWFQKRAIGPGFRLSGLTPSQR